MTGNQWLKRIAATLGTMALLAAVGSPFAFGKDERPRPIPQPAPSTQIPPGNDMDLGKVTGPLLLKNADQINLLNALATLDMQYWPSTLRKNHTCLNDEFIQVMANRSRDAMIKAINAFVAMRAAEAGVKAAEAVKDQERVLAFRHQKEECEKSKNQYFDISFRYAMLADLVGEELHKQTNNRYDLAYAFAHAPNQTGYGMAIAILGNIFITERNNIKAHMLAGEIREKTGDLYGAMLDYQIVIKQEPNHAAAWLAIGRSHLLVNEFVKAREALRRAVSCTDDKVALAEAQKLLDKVEHPSQLPPASDNTFQVNSYQTPGDSATAAAQKGYDMLRENRTADARKEFERSISMDETCAQGHMGLGDLAFRDSNFQEAVRQYEAASRFGKAARESSEALRYLALACEKVYDQTHSPEYLDKALDSIRRAVQVRQANNMEYPEASADQDRLLSKKSNDTPVH